MWSICRFPRCQYLLLLIAIIGLHVYRAEAVAAKVRNLKARSPTQVQHRHADTIAPRGNPDQPLKRELEDTKESIRARRPSKVSGPAFLPEHANLTPGLPQEKTNGKSLLGTDKVGKFNRDLFGSKPLPTRAAKDSLPDTGVTRYYDFDVAYATIAPDGMNRSAILINGQFPGPTIEANYGDWVEVQVTNSMPDQGVSLHWHGLLQKEMPWMDGVPSISQCPIAPNTTFTYLFRADQAGTTWWHSHLSAQYTSGAFGAMIFYGEEDGQDYDVDIGPVILQDWYHEPLFDVINTTLHSPLQQPPPSDNLLINGKMNYDCSQTTSPCVPNAGISKFFFSPGKKYRLRLINTGAAANAKFSIDGHNMTVIAQDFTPLEPYVTDLISLGNGQRCDVIVEANQAYGSSWWMRDDLGDGSNPDVCTSSLGAKVRTAVAAVYYDGADPNGVPTSLTAIDPARLLPCGNDPLNETIPFVPISSDPIGSLTTVEMHINFTQIDLADGTFMNEWTINDVSYVANYSRSLLQDAIAGNTMSLDDQSSLYNMGDNGTVRLVIYDHFQFAHHPMHLHGHVFQVLAEGYGTWDGSITNPQNPSRRDVQVVNRALVTPTGIEPSYTVIQFFSDNPGVWPFHCHLAWHNSAGLYVNIFTLPDQVVKYQLPDAVAQTCVDYNTFSNTSNPTMDDAGI